MDGDANRGHMVGQIVGLPGDKVEIKDGNFVVNNRLLDDKNFPFLDGCEQDVEAIKIIVPMILIL